MSRDDSEFSAYLAARWPALVQTLVFLGHTEREAHGIALDALSRVYPDWSRVFREEDVEVAVYAELLDARDRHLRHGGDGAESHAGAAAHPPPGGLEEAAERREQVEAALAAMAPDDRREVVLAQVAELSEGQIADVTGSGGRPRPQLSDADVRLALEAVPVDHLHVQQVVDLARRRRRRVWSRVLGAVAALALVAGTASWLLDRDEATGEVTRADNPLPLAWYADGLLHLADVTVEVRPVVQLVTVPDGVVMSDDEGEVSMVQASGEVERIGETVPGTSLVVEPDNGWVAWADPGDGDPQLVVHDTRTGEEVGRRSLAVPGEGGGQPVGTTGPIAIDGERVYYATRDNDFVWEPLSSAAFAISGSLVDTADGALISNLPQGYRVQRQPFRSGIEVEGTQGRLTPDGRYAFVVENEEVVVYDVDRGRQIARMYSPSDRAVGWTYAAGSFYFAVLHNLQDKTYQDTLQMPSEGNYRIYECLPERADMCIQATELPEDVADPPVLAR